MSTFQDSKMSPGGLLIAPLNESEQQAGILPCVSTGVKLPTYAGLKFPSLWKVASHGDLPNITPPRMLSVWFQSTEGAKVITWERLS